MGNRKYEFCILINLVFGLDWDLGMDLYEMFSKFNI